MTLSLTILPFLKDLLMIIRHIVDKDKPMFFLLLSTWNGINSETFLNSEAHR